MILHRTGLAIALAVGFTTAVQAGVSSEEAAKLKSTLTPLGGERAGNKDGSIPEWTGGYTTPIPGFKNGGRRGDPFAGEKPMLSITAKNADQYADKLTDGTKAMLKKYPDSFRVDVYKTYRSAAAPQWVYDNTLKNAAAAKLDNHVVKGAFGGIPFPIPKSGEEIVANHILHWRGEAWQYDFRAYLGTADGKSVLSVAGVGDFQMPYYFKEGAADNYAGEQWMVKLVNSGPPVRAGEAIVGRENADPDKTSVWVYLTGQRRVRKLPNACCDTPTPATSGVMSFDEIDILTGRTDRFDWKIIGKKEIYVPYNSNRLHVPAKDSDVLDKHHLNSDYVRWELHRVWVVESTLKSGFRHQAPRSRYYFDEDTWVAVLADRWDGNNQLWRTLWTHTVVMPDLPATTPQQQFGFNDLISGAWFVNGLANSSSSQYKIMPRYKDTVFTPESMAGEGVR